MDQAAADWQGTPANLLAGLTNTAEALGIDTRMKTWPKSPQVLTRRLNLLLDNLADYGITLQAERSVTRTLTIKDSRPATLDRRDKPIRDIIRAELRKIQPAHKTSLQDFKDDLMSRKEVSSQDVDKAFAFFKKNGDLAEPDPGVFYVVPGHDLDATGGRLA